ncbi:MAG: hypothetical protein C0609_03835 [Deltaproteobacteria bacterium]|nr:MAG: hypothetical protein C0609_03835 [Deltaproteobacteria bacterium]
MRIVKFIAAAAFAIALSTPAFALGGPYFGFNYSTLDLDVPHNSDANIDYLSGTIGQYVHPNFAVELRAGLGIDDDKVNGVKVEVDYLVGAYGRVVYPVQRFVPYFLFGVTGAKVSAGSDDESELDLGYGFGTDYVITDQLSLNIEYANIIDGSDIDITAFSMGLRFSY